MPGDLLILHLFNQRSGMDNTANNLKKSYASYLRLECGLSDNSIAGYCDDLDKLIKFIGEENLTAEKLEHADILQFLCTLRDIGIQPRSQARILSGIKSFYRYLTVEEYIKSDPSKNIDTPKIGRHLPEVLTLEEVDRLVGSFDLSLPEGRRNKAIIEVMYSCGLRVSELVNLKISDIYPKEEFIVIKGKGDKQRIVPISQSALKEISLYMHDRKQLNIKKGDEDTLFLNRRGGRLSRVMIFYIVKEQCAACNINKTISPHTLRHTFATHLLEGGANLRAIQQMLGHESITTTEIYVHLDKEYLRQEILLHHPRNIKH